MLQKIMLKGGEVIWKVRSLIFGLCCILRHIYYFLTIFYAFMACSLCFECNQKDLHASEDYAEGFECGRSHLEGKEPDIWSLLYAAAHILFFDYILCIYSMLTLF